MPRASVFLVPDHRMVLIPKGRRLETERDVLSYLGGADPLIVEYGPLADWVQELCEVRGDVMVDLESQPELDHLPPRLRAFAALLPWSQDGVEGRLIEFLVLADGRDDAATAFARHCIEWTTGARDMGPRWIVPGGCLAVGSEGLGLRRPHVEMVRKELASLALPRLMDSMEEWGSSSWLPFMSFQLINRAKRMQRKTLELALRVAIRHVGHRATWHPWDSGFPSELRGVPLDWLLVFGADPGLRKAIDALRSLGLSHLGHLVILHPGMQEALRKVTSVEWMRLYECFSRAEVR